MISSRAAFASLPPLSLPPPSIPHPIPHHTPPAPSPLRTPSRPIPRSPYVNISPQRLARQDNESLPPSPVALHDVLNVRDWVGQGLLLQGQPIRPVCAPNAPQEQSQSFEVVRKLGSGSYAVVYLVREIVDPHQFQHHPAQDHHLAFGDELELDIPQPPPVVYGREFAIKCLSKANLNRDALDAQLFEATVHQSLPVHPNIVTLYRTLETDSFLLLVLECVPGEDLFYFLEQARDHSDDPEDDVPPTHSVPSVTPPTPSLLSSLHPAQLLSPHRLRLIASMFAQMCDAVASCHSVGVYHRDIKPENFIVTDGWAAGERRVVVKLTDFGLATTELESADMDCGSAPYMSYECRNNCAPTYSTRAADVWSLGIVLINMLYHHNPWSDTTAGACPSFEAFRAQPIPFFMHRFPGMTHAVAEFLATRVFCIIEDAPDGDAQRVSAADFGRWVRGLPALLAQRSPANAAASTPLARLPPVAPTPRSRRPSSRPPSRGPAPDDSRPPSQRAAHEFELAEPDLPEADEDEGEGDACSRTTSTARRRRRGARRGRGVAHPPTPSSDPLEDLAAASQILAREISKTSRRSKSPARSAPPAKKPSKWKGVFRMSSPENGDAPPVPMLVPESSPPQGGPSATAANVSTLIMGLSPAPPAPRGGGGGGGGGGEWARGRRPDPRAPRPPAFEQSPAASSRNWRTASSASSVSGGSAFTRFSNGSVRSVSTVATSVSAASSWRVPPASPPASPGKRDKAPLPAPPTNLKIISGVPWELHELPRGCHVRPHEHVFAPPPLRYTMKAQARAAALDTISERERARSPVYQRADAPASAEDVGAGADEDGPKKVQKGQINALAKMLSALKANRQH